MTELSPLQATRQWLDDIVVGLNLCPFAAPVISNNGLYIEVSDADQSEQQLAAVLQQLDKLQQVDASDIETSLLIFSHGLSDFDQYWELVGIANDLLQQVGLEGIIQIASFHPYYQFEEVAEDDVSHYTNRSPYPMLHFIREEQLSRALQSYPDPQQIPQRNIRRLRQLGKKALLKKLAGCGMPSQ
jgi:hypothetical protein